jgi:hypothetical protein
MNQVSEIKCPHCGKWTMWNGQVDDRCLYCSEFLEPNRFSRELEKKIGGEVKKENDYFAVNPGDKFIIRSIKLLLNSVRWVAYYMPMIFFLVVTLIIVFIALFTL